MTSPRLLLLAALLSQGLSSPILSALQQAYLDHWNTELNCPPLTSGPVTPPALGDMNHELTSGPVTPPAIGSSFSEWQQAYLDHWNMELNAGVDHSESGQIEEGMMEENMQESGNQNEDMEDINEDATESAMRY